MDNDVLSFILLGLFGLFGYIVIKLQSPEDNKDKSISIFDLSMKDDGKSGFLQKK